jgi:hypothetical protein
MIRYKQDMLIFEYYISNVGRFLIKTNFNKFGRNPPRKQIEVIKETLKLYFEETKDIIFYDKKIFTIKKIESFTPKK